MNTTHISNDPDTIADTERTTIAAIFDGRDRAHDAIHQLHDEGFRQTWLGVTRVDEPQAYDVSIDDEMPMNEVTASVTRVEADNWFMRMFGEGDESLYEALVRHGVSELDARTAGAAEPLPSHSAILTVNGADAPQVAARIIVECAGRLITQGFVGAGYAPSDFDSMATGRLMATDNGIAVGDPAPVPIVTENIFVGTWERSSPRSGLETRRREAPSFPDSRAADKLDDPLM